MTIENGRRIEGEMMDKLLEETVNKLKLIDAREREQKEAIEETAKQNIETLSKNANQCRATIVYEYSLKEPHYASKLAVKWGRTERLIRMLRKQGEHLAPLQQAGKVASDPLAGVGRQLAMTRQLANQGIELTSDNKESVEDDEELVDCDFPSMEEQRRRGVAYIPDTYDHELSVRQEELEHAKKLIDKYLPKFLESKWNEFWSILENEINQTTKAADK